jgi:RNA polymerase sigma-70 factor, ECF subfamily
MQHALPKAFLIAPKTIGQRLFRAKTKTRSGGIQFEIPQKRDLRERLEAVLEAIYAAFGIGWDDMSGADQRGRHLVEEAIWLARVLLQLMPDEAEIQGLLALMRAKHGAPHAGGLMAGRYLFPRRARSNGRFR